MARRGFLPRLPEERALEIVYSRGFYGQTENLVPILHGQSMNARVRLDKPGSEALQPLSRKVKLVPQQLRFPFERVLMLKRQSLERSPLQDRLCA